MANQQEFFLLANVELAFMKIIMISFALHAQTDVLAAVIQQTNVPIVIKQIILFLRETPVFVELDFIN